MFEGIILLVSAVLNILLGLTVFLKNPKAVTNRLFLFLTFTLVAWSAVNFISVHPAVFSQLLWIRLVLFCGAMLNLSVFLTFLAFPSLNMPLRYHRWARWAVVSTAVIMALTLTPFVFKSLKIVNGSAQPVPNPGIGLFLLQTVTLLGASFSILIKKFHSAHGKAKRQLKLVLLGIAGTFSLIIISNLLLVVLAHFTALVPLGPAFTLVFTGTFSYAIIRHRLFDIRLVIAKSLGYILSIGFLATIYGGLTALLTTLLADASNATLFRQIANVLLLAFAVLTYNQVKQFFERITNRIFYRDAYDPETFLDQLNQILVATVGLSSLMRQVNELVETSLKAQRCTFNFMEMDELKEQGINPQWLRMSADGLALAEDIMQEQRSKVIVTDELEDRHQKLRTLLVHDDIAALVGLVESSQAERKTIGFLALGLKKSGNTYNRQDIKILDIVANELVIAIQNSLRFEEIQAFAETLQHRVDEATHRLQRSNEKLQQMDETKDEFISMASHQLRTPLTSVKGYLSMVLEGDAGKLNDMQRKLLDQAFVSSQRMVYLIADLLNVSRLRTGKFLVEPVEVNLSDIVEGEVSQLFETAKGRGLTLVYKKPDKFPKLMLDETKIRQVVMNFTDNAIYYTPAGGHITIHLVDKKDTVEFAVVDDGIGVPKHEQHHLFTKFYRAPNAKKARPDGTGLGLFMAQKVIIAQGGSIIFHSHEGKGSTFGFSFAKARLRPPEIAPAAEMAKALAS